MSIYEYDEEKHMRQEREEWHSKGLAEGADKVNILNRKLVDAGRQEDLLRSVSDSEFQKKLFKEFGL